MNRVARIVELTPVAIHSIGDTNAVSTVRSTSSIEVPDALSARVTTVGVMFDATKR